MLGAKGEAEPFLDPRHFLVRKARIESHSASGKALDRLGDEVGHGGDHAA